jgi:hypothetical protein
MGRPRCDCLRGAQGEADGPRTISGSEPRLGRDPYRVIGGGRSASFPAGDDQITWATAMRAAPDVACVIAVGYSVNRRIAPKQ